MTTRRSDQPTDDAIPSVGPGTIQLLPGQTIADGRYRLLAKCGEDARANANFWQARDSNLRREVALTVLVGESGDHDAAREARRTVERAAHAARFSHPGIARVLDVISVGTGIDPAEGVLGIVVADWSPGGDVTELLTHPMHPGMAARMVEPLAAAVESAHHSGLVLGVDHPQRVRVTPHGVLKLAFPGPRPDATLRDDVKGLGAILYLLLTGRWALDGGPPGLPGASLGPNGSVISPSTMRGDIPAELASIAVRSLEDTSVGGIRTGAALLRVLDSVAEVERFPPPPTLAPERQPLDDDGGVWTTRRPERDEDQKRKLMIGVAILSVATLGVITWLGLQLISFFSDSADTPGVPEVIVPVTPPAASSPTQAPPPPPPPAAAPVEPEEVAVFVVRGDKDNARQVNRVIDGNPATIWSTGSYRQQFPVLKPGVGIMATFAEPTAITSVAITSPSANTVVEIRSATEETPKLDETTMLGTATLTGGRFEIPLNSPEPGEYLLVWITKLGGEGQKNLTQIAEIEFLRAE